MAILGLGGLSYCLCLFCTKAVRSLASFFLQSITFSQQPFVLLFLIFKQVIQYNL